MIGDPLGPQRHRYSYLEDVRFKHEQRRLLWIAALCLICAAVLLRVAFSPVGTEGRTWEEYDEQLP